jgi:DegV family protein with EDD domain
MSKIAFITDTNSSLPIEVAAKYDIVQIPIHIQFGEETYITGVNIDDRKLFDLIDERKILPTTAAPAPSAFEKAFQTAFDNGAEEIICVCCSSQVSATFNAAQIAANEFPGKGISVVDSLQLTLAEGFQVLGAAEAVHNGATREEALAIIDDIRSKTHVFAALPTLKYLAMGGRMGKLAASLGNTMEIKPILTMNEGKLELLEKIRTLRKAKQRLVELAKESAQDKKIKQVGLLHVNNPEGVLSLYEGLKEVLSFESDPLIGDFTPGLSVHSGAGFIGFVLITE